MGDHRANIKIEMEFHGIEDACDMWLNYSSGSYDGVDDRIVKFISSVYERGMSKYNSEMEEIYEEEHKKETEERERAELARLKRKYDFGENEDVKDRAE